MRHVLHPNAQLCPGGCGKIEDIDHLFVSCDVFGKIWLGIYNWLGLTTVHPKHVADHLLQFEHLGGFSKYTRATFQLICLSSVWVIWRERNAHVFSHKDETLQHLLDKIKLQSYWWLKAN